MHAAAGCRSLTRTEEQIRKLRTIVLLGPDLRAVSGVSTHLNQLMGSQLTDEFRLLHFRVGSEGHSESTVARLWRYFVSPMELWRFLRRNDASAVHINTSMVPKAYWRDLVYLAVAKIAGSQVIYQVHGGSLPLEFCKGSRLLEALLRRLLRTADHVVLLSDVARRGYAELDSDLQVEVIPNAVYVDGKRPTPTDRSDAPLRLVYIGRLVASKGLFEALDALALLTAERVEATLVIAGTGPDEARLRSRARELALDHRIVFAGAVRGDAKDALWQEADVLVFPTYREGLPYALLEAMATWTVPVISPVGAIPEAVEDGVHGLFVPPRDVRRLAEAIKHLSEDRFELRRLAEAAHARAIERYTVQRLAEDFARLYRTARRSHEQREK